MKIRITNNGSAFLIVIFVVALLAAVVMGMLQINTEEIQVMRNQIYAAEAMATAEAGLNDAFSEIRADSSWSAGFTDKVFNGGSYTVDVDGSTITSTGISPQGFVTRVQADVTIAGVGPYAIRINHLRINE